MSHVFEDIQIPIKDLYDNRQRIVDYINDCTEDELCQAILNCTNSREVFVVLSRRYGLISDDDESMIPEVDKCTMLQLADWYIEMLETYVLPHNNACTIATVVEAYKQLKDGCHLSEDFFVKLGEMNLYIANDIATDNPHQYEAALYSAWHWAFGTLDSYAFASGTFSQSIYDTAAGKLYDALSQINL